ncbi:response regulator [Silvibacterium dinghuense]|uniref:Response regulator n=1 Tax=Silvibacterium dinghuense TaxID=1560006 RepID=A0A4Q1SCM5_9BACT|nr:response regulator [Silvibacterium dinghuense]RXS94979.1 response regulator [Silvibacterium dinghuense]GGH09544.1 hypothetical protein GCM10011586_27580 [Silvibacterium dinghuense]
MPSSPLILCIDDELIGLRVRKVVLERAGFRVLTASDGPSGLDLFRQNSVDAVVLDYSMPGMNGDEVATCMRSLRARVPILLLSAYIELPPGITKSVNSTLMKGNDPKILIDTLLGLLHPAQGPVRKAL